MAAYKTAAGGVVFLLAFLIAFFTVPMWMMAFEARPPHGFQPVYAWFSTALVFMLVVTGLWLRKSAQRSSAREVIGDSHATVADE